jgi:hypothetical protein
MKILYDHQIFASQTYGGVSRYFAEVIHRLPTSAWEVTATLSNNHYARHYGIVSCCEFLPQVDFRHKGRLLAELGKPYSSFRLRRGDYDIYHPTNFDTFGLRAAGRRPVVVTYHDTNFLTPHFKTPFFEHVLTPVGRIIVSIRTDKASSETVAQDIQMTGGLVIGLTNLNDSGNHRILFDPFTLF